MKSRQWMWDSEMLYDCTVTQWRDVVFWLTENNHEELQGTLCNVCPLYSRLFLCHIHTLTTNMIAPGAKVHVFAFVNFMEFTHNVNDSKNMIFAVVLELVTVPTLYYNPSIYLNRSHFLIAKIPLSVAVQRFVSVKYSVN